MLVWIVLTGLHLGLVLGGTCIETYSCDKTCYRLHACSLLEFFVEGCFGYRKESYTCKSTCQRCCSGYDENDCDTPLCFGSIACPNGGTCLSPDICGCPSGFASPNCQEVDECTLGVSGCDHICTNTPGSFACSCSSGYVLAKDERKCEDIDECTEQIAGCEHLCNNDEGSYSCSCLQGYYLDNDGKSCLDADECRAEICNNHGVCFEGVRMYTCLCDAGFTGKNCQTDINECELFNGGCQDNCTNTFGSFKCSCLNGGHPCIKALDIRESSFSSPKGNEVTVFERQQIPGQLLPEACFAIQYVDYAEGNDIDIYFSSTSPWYELNSNSDIVYTFGIVFVKVNSFSIPLSLRGMEFKSTNEGFALNYGIEYVSINGTLIAGDLSPICLDFEFSESDFLDFISVDSFTKTVLRSLDNILPDWLEFEKSSSEILSVQDIKTDLVFGRNMDSVQMCAGVPDFPNHLYTVFRFDTGFTLRVLGNDVYFPKTSNSEKYCLIVDITHTYLGTVFLMIPEESRDILSALDIMQALKVKQNINIHPRGIGISLVNGVRADLRSFSGGFWNGDKTFQPPSLGEVNFWIGGLAKKDDSLFTFEGNGDIYIRISRIESMLTSMLREEWIGAVDVQEPLTFTLKLETFSMAFQLDTSTANIYTSVGGSTRTWCGDFSNPEGIFFSGIVKSNPFIGVPFLKDFDIYLTSRVYAYVTTEQQINSLEGFDMNIHKDLLKLDAVLDNTGHFLSVYISKLNLNETFLEVVDMKDLVTKMRTEISVSMDNLLSKNFEHLITNIENIWHKYRQLMDAFESFAQESEFHVYEEKNQFMETLKTNINNITENIKGVLDIVTQKTISSAGNYSEFGMKISTGLTIFDQKLTGLDIEIVYSKGDLFRCSRYDEVIKLLKGESALRFLGKAHGEQRLGNFFEVKEGYRIRGSYAINTDKRVIQLQSFINILGIKIKKDIFINETGVNFYLEGNVWGKVFAQIEASANIGKMWHELKFAVHGKFVDKARKKRNIDSQDFSLQTKDIRVYRNARKRRQVRTVTSSFQDNYLQAMKNVIRMTAYNAQIRLSNAQSAVTAAQKGVNNTKKWLNEKERKLREANEVYDNANRSLETAILVLEKAKRRFQDAITHLNERQRNFDNLCRIRSCKICIPGLRCRICFKRFWFLRIPFPCCTFTNCMIIIPNPFCVIANIICRIIRGFAFFALEAAKGAARSAMQNLDHARQAETLAQIHVNKSKVALTLAEGFHDVAVIRHDIAKWILEDATIALEGVKLVIGTAAKVLQFVIDIGLKDILDVYNCGFNIVLTSKDMPVFKVFCEVNAFRLGWTSINFKINFKNFLQSIWQAARATVQAVTNVFTGIFSGRKRRDIEFKASSKMHVLLRNIRESNADKYLNRTIDISNNITGFNDATDSDYDNRVQLFREKCNRITVIQNFMQYSFESLQDIVNESKSYINEAESVKSLLRGYKDIDSIENVTLENVGISKENANKDYNLTEDDLDQAMNETKNAVIDDPLLAEIRKAANISEENVDAETQSVESVDYLNAWFTSMKNMTKDYFNETECEGFKDCVFFSISNLYDLYEYENIPNITNIRESILDLETVLIETFQNESYSIIDTSATMEYVLNRINTLVEMNTFCAEPPEFLTPLQNQTVLNGSDVTLYCDVHGDPEPSFTWLKNDTIIVGERSSTIIILNVTEKVSFDKYTCIAGNVVANITSDDVYITVIFEDEDECQTGNHSCNHLCNNTVGSYICSCFRGYELQKDSNYICQDIDECKTDNAGCQQACINQEGSFTCACTDGYELDIDSMLCTDINECKTDNGECIYACLNFMGNHTCLCPKRSILEEDLKSCRDVTNSSVSSSISLDVDNATDVSDPDVYISVGKMFESYFRTVTTNILLVFINDLRKRIIADFTIELASENLENNTAKLVKAIVDLKAGDTFILQGKPVQAQSILPENADDLCQVRELIASHCKDGWHCTIESGLPFCREMPNDPAENDIPIIVGIVGSVLAVILLPIFVVIYVRCVKKNNRSGNRVTSDPKDIYIVPRHATQPKKSWNARKNNLLTSSAISISEKDQKVEISDNVRPEQWQL